MKLKIVPSSWIAEGARRLGASVYGLGAIETRKKLEALPTDSLRTLTHGFKGGIFRPAYTYTAKDATFVDDPHFGVPFLTNSAMLRADLSGLPLLSKKKALTTKLSRLRIEHGMTLISCSGSIGRMVYARPEMDGMWSSQDIMKVRPNSAKIPPGYLYAFLSSKFGVPLVISGTYGAIVQHIEREHLLDLPVPRLGDDVEQRVHDLIENASTARTRYQTLVRLSTEQLFEAVGLQDYSKESWHSSGPDLGFGAYIGDTRSFRALNYSPRFLKAVAHLRDRPFVELGDLCKGGYIGTGVRFKRIDSSPDYGIRLIGQKEGFWLRPEGRWISRRHAPDGVLAESETVMIASSGTLGENELYCRAILVTGKWLEYAYTQHFLRILSKDPGFSGAYLFAFLRSELAFRCLRCMSTGGKQQEVHRDLVARLPIPLLDDQTRSTIAENVRRAYRIRDEADETEGAAIALVEQAIEGAT